MTLHQNLHSRVRCNQILSKATFRATWVAIVGASLGLPIASSLLVSSVPTSAQTQKRAESEEQKSIEKRLYGLRSVPDAERGAITKQLALDIRQLPPPEARLGLASGLANLATEGDFGHETLQEVANTLAEALRANPSTDMSEQSLAPYVTLAQLVRYENVRVGLTAPQFAAAMSKLEADDRRRQKVDFTLTDLQGKAWTLRALRGKVVLVNFWATWCPPCRKELPDLQALSTRFKARDLVVLGISDEDAAKVQPFVAQNKMTYPILLDPGRKVNKLFGVQGIPRTFIYDRNGKLAAQAIDMRTQRQFLELLDHAGLRGEEPLQREARRQ